MKYTGIMKGEMNTKIDGLFTRIIERNINGESYAWLLNKAADLGGKNNKDQLNITFTSIPRKTGKKEIGIKETEAEEINAILPGFRIDHWTIDRLSRVWLLIQLEIDDKEKYIRQIESLFSQAEMNELVALYSSLPLLSYPDAWKLRCAEGIRSNIGTVLEAIMYHNPYPSAYLDELAWNQLVMKAFFTDKNVNNIVGLDARANANLANTLFDYVEERWSANRTANPQIWRLTAAYFDERHFYMIEKLFNQENETDSGAAALVCADSSNAKLKLLLDQHPQYKEAIAENRLSWPLIADKQIF
jgi:hypothetical protein